MPAVSKNKRFTAEELRQVHKSVAVQVSFDPIRWELGKKKFKDFGIKGQSEFFDYVLVNGIAYLNHDICQLVIEKAKPIREKFAKKCADRVNKPELKEEKTPVHKMILYLYPRDYDSINRFAMQKNIYKTWIYRILLDEFIDENPLILNFIKYCQELNVKKRKAKMAYLTQDNYILALNPDEAKILLNKFTENYDNKKFDNELVKEVWELKEQQEKQAKEENELEDSLQKKIAELRTKRLKEAKKIAEPVLDDEGELLREPGGG